MKCLACNKETVSNNSVDNYCEEHYTKYLKLIEIYKSNFDYMDWEGYLNLFKSVQMNFFNYDPDLIIVTASGAPNREALKVAEAELKNL